MSALAGGSARFAGPDRAGRRSRRLAQLPLLLLEFSEPENELFE
jgi:hypothetical protein